MKLAILVAFLAAVAMRIGGPAIADEVDFLLPIQAWVQGGPQPAGLWHTPFYPWFLSLLGKVFGLTPAVARSIGVVCMLATAVLIYRTACLLWPRLDTESDAWISRAVWAAALGQPLLYASALLLDYDNTLMTLATAYYFYLLVKYALEPARSSWKMIAHLGIAMGFCLMGKETTPWCYPIGALVLFGQLAIRRGASNAQAALRAAGQSIAVACLGAAVFFGAIGIWCASFGISPFKVFEMAVLGLKVHGGTSLLESRGVATFVWVKVFPLFWLGLPVLGLLISGGRKLGKTTALYPVFAVMAVVFFTYTFLINQMTYQFPKYMLSMLVWLAPLGVATVDAPTWSRMQNRVWLGLSATLGLFGPWVMAPLYYRMPISFLAPAQPVAFVLAVTWFLRKRFPDAWRMAWVLASLAFAVSYFHALIPGNRSPAYWPGEQAMAEAHQALAPYLTGEYALFSPIKDLAYEFRSAGMTHLKLSELPEMMAERCASGAPAVVVSRIREAETVLAAEESISLALKDRPCRFTTNRGQDIVIGVLR
ncbi:MAG: glycosyltransferase family 39 protein [Bacteriovoracia bacterium]